MLTEEDRVVLTENQAKLYFPGISYADMIGKDVIYDDSLRVTVAGVVEQPPATSDFRVHDFISYPTIDAHSAIKKSIGFDHWTNTNGSSQLLVKLKPGVQAGVVAKAMNGLLAKYREKTAHDGNFTQTFALQPLVDVHFNDDYAAYQQRTASRPTLYGLALIAAFLLALACINFINLTTAQSGQRAKEIGIRKTMGSSRRQILVQFLAETFVLTCCAAILALALTPLAFRMFKEFIPDGATLGFFQQPFFFVTIVVLVIVVSVLAGLYPGMVLSGFRPLAVLKNQVAASGSTRTAWLRKSLTVGQFVIAQFFIMATVMVSKQMYYMLHKDLGFRKDAIVYFETPWQSRLNSDAKKTAMLNYLRTLPQVERASLAASPPSSDNANSTEMRYTGGKSTVTTDVQLKRGDADYIDLYGIRIIAGKNLAAADTAGKMLINETYARTLGFSKPADAVNKQLDYNDEKWVIKGVMHDFNQKSLHSEIKPSAFFAEKPGNLTTFHIAFRKTDAGSKNWTSALKNIRSEFKRLYPDQEFEYQFVDESIAKFYAEEQKTSSLLAWATGLSIFISCMGLLGLAVYTTSLRTKEIGIRKVLGATVSQIVGLLSRELVLLVLLASAIVTPLAVLASRKWLEHFAEKTPVSWWIFVSGALGMLIVALLVSTMQTVRAAAANPVNSLRNE